MAKVKRKQKVKESSLALYVMVGAGVLLLAAVLFIVLQGRGSRQATTTFPGQAGADGIPRASLEEAKQAFDEGTAVFLDVRGDDVYDMQHVSGALSIPLGEVESRLSELEPGDWIIPYCT